MFNVFTANSPKQNIDTLVLSDPVSRRVLTVLNKTRTRIFPARASTVNCR